MAEFQYSPINGFRDEAGFPNPTTETAARAQVQSLLDQARDAINDVSTDMLEDITTNRKLSATGDFTGTLNGGPILASDPGLQATVIALQDEVTEHKAETAPHGAVSIATANKLIVRDASGRAKVAAPSAADDIARKDNVDAVQTNLNVFTAIKTATITTTWTGSSAPYTQVIAVTDVTANDNPVISPVFSTTLATAILQKEAWNMVGKIVTGAGNINVTCFEEKPTTAIPIQIKGA